jgi:hypothetical protein
MTLSVTSPDYLLVEGEQPRLQYTDILFNAL